MMKALSYFEHNERTRGGPISFEVIEMPQTEGIVVQERQISREEFAALVRKTYGASPTTSRDTE
jgi:hypothetical protein